MRTSKEARILDASNRLFLQVGYKAATMRQIAEAADVSLGLATYHFKSKRQIAVLLMEGYLRYLKEQLGRRVRPEREPLMHSAAMVRLCMEFFLSHPCRRFYLECLEREIYMESIQKLGNEGLSFIAKAHHMDSSPDLLLLFDNYIPPSVEKILLLEKEKGNFPGISYDEIPDIVFSITVERHLEKEEIHLAAQRARSVAREVLEQIPVDITQTLFTAESAPFVVSNIVL